jgi:hypothetical protein
LAEQRERAVQGRGAFRRFRDTLSGAPTKSSPDGIASPPTASEDGPEFGSLIAATNHDREQLVATPRHYSRAGKCARRHSEVSVGTEVLPFGCPNEA